LDVALLVSGDGELVARGADSDGALCGSGTVQHVMEHGTCAWDHEWRKVVRHVINACSRSRERGYVRGDGACSEVLAPVVHAIIIRPVGDNFPDVWPSKVEFRAKPSARGIV
jgi:hypothetical protein